MSRRRNRWSAIAVGLCAAIVPCGPVAVAAGPEQGLDSRAWELVTPAEMNGGAVGAPGSEAAGVLAAAAGGESLAFGSLASFGSAAGSLPVNQYIARRGAAGWSTENVTPAALSGTYDRGAYELFSEDLGSAVLGNGWSCRDGSASCPAENPPLGAGAPAGYRNLYLRDGPTFVPLVTTSNAPLLTVSAEDFELSLAAASPDLRHVAISTCAALVPGATEVPGAEGCDPAAQNLYAWADGQLELVNVLPGEAVSTPGAALAAARGAVSANGSRVYWTLAGDLYLREGGATELVAAGAEFKAASRDGSLAFYLKGGHLHRYEVASGEVTDLTPAGGVLALVGSSDEGASLYYVRSDGLYRFHGGLATRLIATIPSRLPPATGAARASADGSRFFFVSPGPLRFQDTNGAADVYEWEAQGTGSCQQAGGCFGLISNGRVGSATLVDASASGEDVFFATTTSLLPSDLGSLDVYDARVGGGFPEPAPPTPCFGDDCQGPAPAPEFHAPPTATLVGHPNPPLRFTKRRGKAKKKQHRPGRGRHKQRQRGGRR